MGVFLGYTQAHHRILLDRRLYLPQKWSTDNARRKTCGVPKDVEFQTKAQQGLELVRVAQKRKIPYAFIGFDCHGRIEQLGEAQKTANNFTHSHPKPIKYAPFEAKFEAVYPNDHHLP